MQKQTTRPLLILAICCFSIFIIGTDNTITNVALPSIQHDLQAKVSNLQWIIDAYTLVLASFLILSGSLADRFGRKRLFQIGLGIFSFGSLLCSLAPNVSALIAARVIQAIGGSMLSPVAMSIVTNTFTERRARAQAIGVWAGVYGLSLACGPILGGLLIGATDWRSVFWVNIPVGIVALILTAVFIPESRAAHVRHLDLTGQVLATLLLGSLVFGIIEGAGQWTAPHIIAAFFVAAISLVLFIIVEKQQPEPLLSLHFFKSIPFTSAVLVGITGFVALSGFLFLNSLYLQDFHHFSALDTGLLSLPIAIATLIFGPVAGWLLARYGALLPLIISGGGMATGAILLTFTNGTTPVIDLLGIYSIFGIGVAMLSPPITNAAVSGMPNEQAGVAAAVATTSRQVGVSLGVAVIGTVVSVGISSQPLPGFLFASHAAWWIIAGCGAAVMFLGIISTTKRAQASAALISQEFSPSK